jgi:hypothetical protein
MAIAVPSRDIQNYPKYQEYLGILAQTTATTSTVHAEAAKQRLIAVSAELLTTLMHSGKVTPASLIAAGTYGT